MLRGQNASRTRAVVSHFTELIVVFYFMKTNNRCLISFSNFVMVLINRWQYFLSSSSVCGLWKINKCLFIPNCTRKIMWLRVNNIHGKIRDRLSKLSISKARVSSAKIFQKLKDRLNSSRNCSVCVRITFDEMKSSFARFNHVCF